MPEGQRRLLLTPAVGASSRTNFSEGAGTLRLWFAPNWASTSAGGSGPGDWAILFDLFQTNAVTNLFGTLTTITNPFRLVLAADAAGTNLVVGVDTLTNSCVLLRHPISFSTGVWHQIAFACWSNRISLVVDDNPETISTNVPPWPSSSVWNQSAFSLGGGFTGHHLSQGQLDEIYMFKFPLSTNYLTWTYQAFAPVAALGPIPDDGGGIATMDAPSPCDPCPSPGTNDPPATNSDIGGWTTGPFILAPVPYITNGTGYVVKLFETNSANTAYEIYQTTALTNSSLFESAWTRVATGAVAVTNFILPFSTNTPSSFIWAARYADTDGDLDSDAYEALVLRTSATNYNDADSDGLSDRYETNHGTDPNKFDSDGDGLGDQVFSLSWWMLEASDHSSPPFGDLIKGDGFRVFSDTVFMKFFFDQYYLDVPLKNWLDDNDSSYVPAIQLSTLPNGSDNHWHEWVMKYDFRTLNIYRDRTNGALKLVRSVWMDNMTERLGTNAAATFTVNSSAQMTNVVLQPFQHPRKSPYLWEGIVGNTSEKSYGGAMHKPFWPIKKMASGGSNLFYTCEYNEGNYQIQMFSPTNAQAVLTNFSFKTLVGYGNYGLLFTNLAVQTNAIFAAGNTFTRLYRVANTTAGTLETIKYNNDGTPVVAEHGLTQASASSVVLSCTLTSNGQIPAGLTNTQTYFLRVSNTTLLTLHTNANGALFNSNRANIAGFGSGTNTLNIRGLIYAYSVTNFVPLGTNNSFFPGQFDPTNLNPPINAGDRLAVATNPVDGKIAVFDSSSQQVKIYNANGTNVALTIGTNGGYANGPSVPYPVTGDTNFAKIVKLGGYYDDTGVRIPRATLCYQPDGKLWVSDTPTARVFRFNSDGSLDTFIETVPLSYRVSVDPNNTNRVFGNYLEFRVNHSQALASSWVLTNYWGHDVTTTNGNKTGFVASFPYGFQTVVTITNWGGTNRTFAHRRQDYRLVELADSGMKEMLTESLGQYDELDASGAVNLILTNGGSRSFQRRTMLFTNGLAYLSAPQEIASINNFSVSPRADIFKIAGTNFILFDPVSTNLEYGVFTVHSGPHLGAIATNGTSTRLWTWTNSFGGVMDGRGTFETNATYAGGQMIVNGDEIFFVYEGEGWQSRLANQIFQFKTDGRFVGQFGVPLALGGNTPNPPGSGSNLLTVSAVRVGNTLYLYTNDEGSRGIHRWRLDF